jgi:hypothetical protein
VVQATGAAVGWGAEGAADGCTLGNTVGAPEGDVVGRIDVGVLVVGCPVGNSVGTSVWTHGDVWLMNFFNPQYRFDGKLCAPLSFCSIWGTPQSLESV